MKATLKSVNYPNISKTLNFIVRDDEVVITTDDGMEIASLEIGIVVKQSINNEETPTDSYWLKFNPVKSSFADCADVYIPEITK